MSSLLSVYRESEGKDLFSGGGEGGGGAAAACGEHHPAALCCVPCTVCSSAGCAPEEGPLSVGQRRKSTHKKTFENLGNSAIISLKDALEAQTSPFLLYHYPV